MKVRTCDTCNKPCELVAVKSNPEASEWYCPRCHKSYDVPELAESEA